MVEGRFAAKSTTHDAFVSISRCANVASCLRSTDIHPCCEIVRSQNISEPDDFQVPEPWVGQIDIAPILFVASNPSIGEDDHAKWSSTDDDIWDSHHLAFGGGRRHYIDDGIRTTSPDGAIIKPVRYWASVRARARELIPERAVVPGRDYAMTEVVHCKSKDEKGVLEAVETCVKMHLETVMAVSGATVVVAMGAFARRWILGDEVATARVAERTLGGKTRIVVAMPHPNSRRGAKTFAKNLTVEEMERLIRVISQSPSR